MPTLSLIMIVKDESVRLPHCLTSVREIVDEMVIADTGSQDDTVSVARSFGAKVYQVPWHDDFADARNRGMAYASGHWLLHLDADELVDAASAQGIREVIDADGHGADAVEVTVANYSNEIRSWRWVPVEPGAPYARGAAGYLDVKLLRLFRNGRGFEYREAIHENISESVYAQHASVRQEHDIFIHRYGLTERGQGPTSKDYMYLAIARKKADQRRWDPKTWYDLGEVLVLLGMKKEGEEAYRTALSLAPTHVDAASSLASLLLNRGDLDEARLLLEGLAEAGCSMPHIGTALGAIAYREGRLDEARRYLENVLERSPKCLMAKLYLARTFNRLGMAKAARDQLESAVSVAPTVKELGSRLEAHRLREKANEAYSRGAVGQALTGLVESLRLDPEEPLTYNDLGVVLNALSLTDKAKESFQRALRLAPGLPEAEDNLRALAATPTR